MSAPKHDTDAPTLPACPDMHALIDAYFAAVQEQLEAESEAEENR